MLLLLGKEHKKRPERKRPGQVEERDRINGLISDYDRLVERTLNVRFVM